VIQTFGFVDFHDEDLYNQTAPRKFAGLRRATTDRTWIEHELEISAAAAVRYLHDAVNA
jgi:hypothetical protein